MHVKALVVFVAAIVTLLPPPISAGEDENKLLTRWEAHRKEVATASIRFRTFRSGNVKQLSRDEILGIIRTLPVDRDPDRIGDIISAVRAQPSQAGELWATMQIYLQGDKVREAYVRGGKSIKVIDGNAFISYSELNKQAVLTLPNTGQQEYLRSIGDFRYIPKCASVSIGSRTDKDYEATATGCPDAESLTVDRQSGVVLARNVKPGTPKDAPLLLQLYPTEYPGGVVFPALVFHCTFDASGLSKTVSLSLIESASFNDHLPADAFSVKVPAGVTILDKRGEKVQAFKTTKDVESVAAFAGPAPELPASSDALPDRTRSGTYIWIGLTTVFILAVAAAFWTWRVRNRRTPRGTAKS